jgi:outer membrane protein
MKIRLVLLFLLVFLVSLHSEAQKFGYIDMEFITSKMPEYQKAQSDVDKFSERWAKEIQDKYSEIDRLQRLYQAEEILLTDDLKRKRQQEISDKEKEAREYNSKIFGMEGMLFQKKKELIKPLTDQIYKSVERVARQRRVDFIFDKSSEFMIIYSNPVHDYTDYVIEDLGIINKDKNNKASADAVDKSKQTKN